MPIRLVFSSPFDPWSTSSESDISRAIELRQSDQHDNSTAAPCIVMFIFTLLSCGFIFSIDLVFFRSMPYILGDDIGVGRDPTVDFDDALLLERSDLLTL